MSNGESCTSCITNLYLPSYKHTPHVSPLRPGIGQVLAIILVVQHFTHELCHEPVTQPLAHTASHEMDHCAPSNMPRAAPPLPHTGLRPSTTRVLLSGTVAAASPSPTAAASRGANAVQEVMLLLSRSNSFSFAIRVAAAGHSVSLFADNARYVSCTNVDISIGTRVS